MTSTTTASQPRTWDESLSAVMDFVASNGRYPTSKANPDESRLRSWLYKQRRHMSGDRVVILDEKLPEWRGGTDRRTWHESLALTRDYVAAHGKNPAQTDPDPDVARLSNWLKDQRMNVNVNAERATVLDAAIPGWRGVHPGHRPWEESFAALGAFIRRHGRMPRPGAADEEARLRNWVDDQRYRADAGQRARLDSECPGWDVLSYSFESRLEETKTFHAATGRLPRQCDKGDARVLGIWLSYQRQIAGPERRAMLDAAFPGWHVTLESQWESTLDGYAGFVEAHGRRPRPRATDPAECSLARWMQKQRANATGDRIARLDAAVPDWRSVTGKHRTAARRAQSDPAAHSGS